MTTLDETKDAGRSIHLTISLDDAKAEQTEAQVDLDPEPLFVDETRLIELANLIIVNGERNTEHGLTTVRLVEFRDEEQRRKIIQMLGESFPRAARQLVPYLQRLGTHPRAALRKRAAEAVGELMCEVDFIRYKEDILVPWAQSNNPYANSSVGLALAVASKNPRFSDNVKTLVKYWVTLPNLSLNWTAVASCVQLGPIWPEDTLDILETALKRELLDLLVLTIYAIRQLCHEGRASLVLARLSRWISNHGARPSFRGVAALIFLEVIRLSHVVGDDLLIDHAATVFKVGLSDLSLPDIKLIRDAMLETLKSWAEESFDDQKKQTAVEALFGRIHSRAEIPRDRDRIVYYLNRWARDDGRFAQILKNLDEQK